MSFIVFDEIDKSINIRHLEEFEGSYTIGDLLINFLDVDFTDEMITRLKSIACEIDKYIAQGENSPGLLTFNDPIKVRLDQIMNGLIKLTNHAYFQWMREYSSWIGKSWIELKELFLYDYKSLQIELAHAVFFCLDIDAGIINRKAATSNQRYKWADELGLFPTLISNQTHTFSWRYDWLVDLPRLAEADLNKLDYNHEFIADVLPQRYLQMINTNNNIYQYGHRFENINPSNLLTYEFELLVKRSVRIRKCKYCQKYFIIKGEHDTHYCDRLQPPTKRRKVAKKCSDIGPKLEAEDKRKNDPVRKEHKNSQDRMRIAKDNGKISIGDFSNWEEKALEIKKISTQQNKQLEKELLKIVCVWFKNSNFDNYASRISEADEIINLLSEIK